MSENPPDISRSKVSASQILITMRADSVEATSSPDHEIYPPSSLQDNIEVTLAPRSTEGNIKPSKISTPTTNNNVDLNDPPSPSVDFNESYNNNDTETNSPEQENVKLTKTSSHTQDDNESDQAPTGTQENVEGENAAASSSDDEVVNNNSLQPIIYDDDLIFDKDEDAKSIEESPDDQYHPSTDHYRRIFLN